MGATAIPAFASSAEVTRATSTTTRIAMWPLYATLFSSACIVIGLIWDISWHRTVGRDTFWTYPHVLEQVAAIVSGIGCGWLVLHTTFARSATAVEARSESVRIWGMRGPLGAWLCIWGTVMMITSAPFDNWWHNAYGLDVKIVSPPHTILGLGMVGIELGALLIALAAQNRPGGNSRRFGATYVVAASVIVCMNATMLMEFAGFANEMHNSFFYELTAWIFPVLLVAFARGASLRWPATITAAAYMAIVLVMMWTLQLFPAIPKLAPIYNPVTHMVPPPFPFLLIVPAFFIDVLMRRFGRGRDWMLALTLGAAFVASFALVQWFLADFLLSPYARNIVFAGNLWDYNAQPGDWQTSFWNDGESPAVLTQGLILAAVFAAVSSRVGLWLGNTMRRVKR